MDASPASGPGTVPDPAADSVSGAGPAAQPVDLVLEGGGVKGIALAGALEVLEERGYRIQRIAGSSAGALAGALAVAGISAGELVEILRSTDYRRFADGPWWTRTLPGAALGVLLHNGVHPGTYLRSWLAEQLEAHGDLDPEVTFGQLRWSDPDPSAHPTGAHAYRLVVTASDLSEGTLLHLPMDASALGTAADALRVVDAVRASTSIPLFYRPVRTRDVDGDPSVLVDGGMLSNFPVGVFDRPGGQAPRWPTFGIKLSAKPEAHFGVRNRIRGPFSYAKAVVDTVTGFYDRMHIDASHAVARTIFIDTAAVRPTEFDLAPADAELLYRKGRAATLAFLDGDHDQEPWDFEAYTAQFRTR